jgi:hypothetical protein
MLSENGRILRDRYTLTRLLSRDPQMESWLALTGSERAILPVLLTFADPETGITTISYRGIMHYADVGSPSTISKVLKRFVNMHLLTVSKRRDGALRVCNEYRLSVDDPQFQDAVGAGFRRHREETEAQRSIRAEQRKARKTTCIG